MTLTSQTQKIEARTIEQITFDHALDSYTYNLLIDFEKFTLNRLKKNKLLSKELLDSKKDLIICYSNEDRETIRKLIEERRKIYEKNIIL